MIAPDAIVVVRGRLDHKDRGETKLVVQEAERFEPDREEIAPGDARRRAVGAAEADDRRRRAARPACFEELKAVFEHHKGDADVHLAISPADGEPTQAACSATPTGCGPRAACAPSWTRSSAPTPGGLSQSLASGFRP